MGIERVAAWRARLHEVAVDIFRQQRTAIWVKSPLTPALSRPASASGCGRSALQARLGELAGRRSMTCPLKGRPLSPCGRGRGTG